MRDSVDPQRDLRLIALYFRYSVVSSPMPTPLTFSERTRCRGGGAFGDGGLRPLKDPSRRQPTSTTFTCSVARKPVPISKDEGHRPCSRQADTSVPTITRSPTVAFPRSCQAWRVPFLDSPMDPEVLSPTSDVGKDERGKKERADVDFSNKREMVTSIIIVRHGPYNKRCLSTSFQK